MKPDLQQRLSITGMVGLASLSGTHWMRENGAVTSPAVGFVVGVMPNLAAAFAMPLVLASLLPSTAVTPVTAASRRAYLWLLAFTTCGLCGWELVQTRSDRFVFDVADLGMTWIGALLAWLAFHGHAGAFRAGSAGASPAGEA